MYYNLKYHKNKKLNDMTNDSQCKCINRYMSQNKTITRKEASRLFGCERLAARIFDLKKMNVPIDKNTITTLSGKRVAEYFIKKP